MIELNSVEKLTKFLNQSINKEWIVYCKSNLKLYYEFQFEPPLKFVRTNLIILEKFESIIKSNEVDKKEAYDLIRFNILFGLNNIKRCKEALEFLNGQKYFKENKIRSFQNEFSQIESILLNYTRKFAIEMK